MHDFAKVVEATRVIEVSQRGQGFHVEAGTEGRLVGRADDGSPVVQFPALKLPLVVGKDDVRLKYPFHGLFVAVHFNGLTEQAHVMVLDTARGELLDHSEGAVTRRRQALLVIAGELAFRLWDVRSWDREDYPDILQVLGVEGDAHERLVQHVERLRASLGMNKGIHNHEWLP